ncbi:DUF2953 domain-containing protein [Terribacillus sp. 7520-G]|uniref:DUF2953 domain-containing protein n=1 Tax=Terribacillus TaxID=459532 RepID=UPI000BA76208|nr:DUF2953 domain-containing protein [Terribacillus sp. 7520-G]PAD37379.1 hypothetical protein CHH53_16495 [Terribacillus sp. 7520-G]
MWIAISVMIGLLLLLLVAITAKVTFHFQYDSSDWSIQIRIFGICVQTWRLEQQSSIEPASSEDLNQQLVDLFADLQKIRDSFPYLLRITRNAELRQLRWHTRIGMSDAASAGTLVGLIWTVKGIVNQVIRSNFRIGEPFDIQVQPIFNNSTFHTSFQCIVSIRTGKAMHAIISNARGR